MTAGAFNECRLCPPGTDCPALSNVTISPSHYAVRDPVTLAIETFLCDGGRCAANGACGPNRVAAESNPLCGQCLPGHSEWAGTCLACSGVNWWLLLGLLILACVCTLGLHVVSQRSSSSSALRITMFFWQVSFLIVGSAAWVRWASFLDLNYFTAGSGSGSACPFPVSPHDMLVLRVLGPLLSFALLGFAASLHRGLDVAGLPGRDGPCRRMPPFDPVTYWRTAISLYFFTFNSVTRACLDFFNCASLPGGRFLVALPAVRCDEGAYRGLMLLVVLILAVYTLVAPCFIAARLHGALRELRTTPRKTEASDAREGVWSVVYGPLHPHAFWWSLAQMLTRATLVSTAVFLRADDHARCALFALQVGASTVLLLRTQPNVNGSDNEWELGTLAALSVLSLSEIMGLPDAWLALVTLGVGGAVSARLALQMLRRLAVARTDDWGGPEHESGRASLNDNGDAMPMVGAAYMALGGHDGDSA